MPKGIKGFQKGNKEAKKKGAKRFEKEMAFEFMRAKILEKWGGLIEKKIELAEGVFVMKPMKQGKKVVDIKVYKEKPDSQSLEYLFSVVVGKPKESIDLKHSGEIATITDEQIKRIASRITGRQGIDGGTSIAKTSN